VPGDADAVHDLLHASYGALLVGDYDEDVLAAALPLLARPNPALLSCGTWYVASSPSGELIGCGGWTAERPGTSVSEGGLAHFRHFAVHPRKGRRGIATALAERSFRDATAAGRRRFECYSTLSAVPFYRSIGFENIEAIGVPLVAGLEFPGVLMRCSR
jgi:GNAT superfamily N-acetyltransferase